MNFKQYIKSVAINCAKKIECNPLRYNDILVALFHDIEEEIGDFDPRYTVNGEVFKAQIDLLLQNEVSWLTASELLTQLDKQQFLHSAVCITFDDGKLSSYQPILEMVRSGGKATQFIIPNRMAEKGIMSWEQISSLNDAGVEIGSHTLSHPDLTKLNEQKIKHELHDSKAIIEDKLGKEVVSFAYPYGAWNQHVAALVQEAGYKIAFTTQHIYASNEFATVNIPRFEPANLVEMNDIFYGAGHYFYRCLKKALIIQAKFK